MGMNGDFMMVKWDYAIPCGRTPPYLTLEISIWGGSIAMGNYPKIGWFIRENPI